MVPEPTFWSTGVVAAKLKLTPAEVRDMISAGSLPEPEWVQLSGHSERVYSLEWLMLAGYQVNGRRLPGFEEELPARDTAQFALRFPKRQQTTTQVAAGLNAIDALWNACSHAVAGSVNALIPSLQVRRMTVSAHTDVLVWVDDSTSKQGRLAVGAAASVFVYVLRFPDRVEEALPRLLRVWQVSELDTGAAESAVNETVRAEFEAGARRSLGLFGVLPSAVALTGPGTVPLEAVAGAFL